MTLLNVDALCDKTRFGVKRIEGFYVVVDYSTPEPNIEALDHWSATPYMIAACRHEHHALIVVKTLNSNPLMVEEMYTHVENARRWQAEAAEIQRKMMAEIETSTFERIEAPPTPGRDAEGNVLLEPGMEVDIGPMGRALEAQLAEIRPAEDVLLDESE